MGATNATGHSLRPGRRRQIALAAASVAIGVVAAQLIVLRTTSPVSEHEAVARFRKAASAPALAPGSLGPTATAQPGGTGTADSLGEVSTARPGGPAGSPRAGSAPQEAARLELPRPGVYTYDTRGYEQLDLPGARHEYPSETTVTVIRNACGGMEMRWDALEERWESVAVCLGGSSLEVRALGSYHEFYGIGDARHFTCQPGIALRPPTADAGTTWGGRCAAGDTTSSVRGEVVGAATLTIAGQPVETVHVRIENRLSGGDVEGLVRFDNWYRTADNLLVRRVASAQAEGRAAFGSGRYTEEYEIVVRSLEPKT